MSKKRFWELDTLRGFAFILMVFDHLTFNLGRIFRSMWFSGPSEHFLYQVTTWALWYREATIGVVIRFVLISGVFLFVSGIVSNLSRNNFKRGLRLFLIALCLTLVTMIFEIVTSYPMTIYFGILHCLSISMMLAPLLMKLKNVFLVIIGVLIIIFGILFDNIIISGSFLETLNNYNLLIVFNIKSYNFASADYYPLLPFMGTFVFGIVFGRIYYSKKESIFKKEINFKILKFLGRNALWLYFAHQVFLFALLYLIGIIFF